MKNSVGCLRDPFSKETKIKLTDEQLRIVHLECEEHLVLAPPGTGKTELLAQRIEYALSNGVSPERMACFTFTNRAAKNMIERVGDQSFLDSMYIGNIHRYCNKYLRKNHLIPRGISLLDDEDQSLLFSELLTDSDICIVEDRYSWKERLVRISELKSYNNYLKQKTFGFPDDLLSDPHIRFINESIEVANTICLDYENIKEKSCFIDFDDLLTLTYNHLRTSISPDQETPFAWIQIDEVQDLNPLQWSIINYLSSSKKSHRVFFGDTEQAIFSFMGSKASLLTALSAKATVHALRTNFRSPQYLLDLYTSYANKLLDPHWSIPPTSNESTTKPQNALRYVECEGTEIDEVNQVIDFYLDDYTGVGTTAFLVRYNKTADRIANKLSSKNLDYFKVSGFDLFQRKIAKDLMAVYKVICDDTDRNSWARIFNLYASIQTLKSARDFVNEIFEVGLNPTDLLENKYNSSTALERIVSVVYNDRVVLFDTETTGLDTDVDDIIQIAAVELVQGEIGEIFEVFIDSDIDLTSSELIHHISKQYLKTHCVPKAEALSNFLAFVRGDALIAHNIEYDYKILNANLSRNNLKVFSENHPKYDTVEIAKRTHPKLPSYKLEYLLDALSVSGANSHNALDDVKATTNLLLELMKYSKSESKTRKNFLIKNEKVIRNFKNRFSPLYESLVFNAKPTMGLDKITSSILSHMRNKIKYKMSDQLTFPQKTDPLEKLVNGLNWTEGDPYEAPIHRRTDHWYFEGSRSRR